MTEGPDFSELKLLVVDDSPINHRVVTLSLRGRFKQIDSAYNGLEAFEKFKKTPYNVILMDVRMPVMSGYESTAIIRLFEKEQEMDKKTFIIAMTASDATDDITKCQQMGMDDYLGKPFIVANFLRLLEEKYNPLP